MKYIHSRKSLHNRLLNLSCVIENIDLQDVSIHDNENSLNTLYEDLEAILDDLLEKDEPEEKRKAAFKVGDKVKVLTSAPGWSGKWVGQRGKVSEVDLGREAPYWVDLDGGMSFYMTADEIELANHDTKFQIGQSVKVVGNLSNRVLGKTGKVASIRDDDRGRYAQVDLDDQAFTRSMCFEDDEIELVKANTTTKFQVGQEVAVVDDKLAVGILAGKKGKIIALLYNGYDYDAGKKGKIVDLLDNEYDYSVELEGCKFPYAFRENELKFVELSVGQEVEIVDSGSTPPSFIYMKGHIDFVSDCDNQTYPYHVKFGDGWTQWFMANEVKPVGK